jgi:hypothetical protein
VKRQFLDIRPDRGFIKFERLSSKLASRPLRKLASEFLADAAGIVKVDKV